VKAWWSYCLALAVGAVLWIGVAVAGGPEGVRTALTEPIPAAILLAPIFLAGLNIVAFRRTHEVVCRMDAERHRSLSVLVGRGCSGSNVRGDRTRSLGARRCPACVGCKW
jgi:hypothetical protein